MNQTKKYTVVTDEIDTSGIVGREKGTPFKKGDVISAADGVSEGNLRAWLRFGQIEELTADGEGDGELQPS